MARSPVPELSFLAGRKESSGTGLDEPRIEAAVLMTILRENRQGLFSTYS